MTLDSDAVQAPNSPEWWLLRLGKQLAKDRPRFDLLEAYADGRHPLPFGNRKVRDAYRTFQKMARANFTGLVSTSVGERLQVTGFSTGSDGDDSTDREAWRTWQRNQMDADSELVHQAALDLSRSYVIVGAEDGKALITPEDPRWVIHEFDPQYRRRVRAALKVWDDDVDGKRHAILYLTTGVVYFVTVKPASECRGEEAWHPGTWSRDLTEGDESVDVLATPGIVPVVPFINRRKIATMGMGEFEDVIDIQDRINGTILDRLVIQAAQAYRQRWMTGVKVEDEHGNADAPFDPGADLIWSVEDEKAKFGDFEAADIDQILNASKEDIRQLAAISRTPPHYLVGELNNVNGETLKATETGLVAKCSNRKRHWGEDWETVNKLSAIIEGRTVADDSETIWADSESRSVAELADAAVKKQATGVPWRQNMADLGYSPSQIDRMEAERTTDAIIAGLAQPEPTPAPVPAP